MKKIMKLLVVFALALAVFGQQTVASAGGGGGFNFKGPSTLAAFTTLDGCIQTDVFVLGSDSVSQDGPGRPTSFSYASVTVSQVDVCSGSQLLYAYGSAAPLAGPNFQVSSKLDSAALNATATLFDEVSGTNFDVEVSLNWSGSGARSRTSNNSRFHSAGCNINTRSNGTSRYAQATGSVTDGVTNFTPQASYDGYIASVKSGYVTAGCK
jgi:hypothetical protein